MGDFVLVQPQLTVRHKLAATRLPLDSASLIKAARHLGRRDKVLCAITETHGFPPLWGRPQSLATLVLLILEQQVSLASAQAVYARVVGKIGTPNAASLIRLGDGGLRRLGVTRQKSRYMLGLARAVLDKALRIRSLGWQTDEQVRQGLTGFVGIGEWTANIYLLMALRRPDVWPAGDLALLVAIGRLYGYPKRPTSEQGVAHAKAWEPYRSVAARMLWHWYLKESAARKRLGV